MAQLVQLISYNMDIRISSINIEFSEKILDLLSQKYYNCKYFEYFLEEYKRTLDFCINSINISTITVSYYENNIMRGNITIIFDQRLTKGEALFGFLELPNDKVVFKSIWETILKISRDKGISILKGPINGSVWHQYRCIKETDSSDFFKSELFTEKYYYDFLSSSSPIKEITYHSGYREKFDAILNVGQEAYDKLESLGFYIKEMDSNSLELLKRVVEISKVTFRNNWSYVDLDQSELYSADKLISNTSTIYLLYHGQNMIGFSGVFMNDNETLIFKTIAIMPEYQGTGLGNALAYRVHLDAKKKGINKIIYALVREDNNIKNFPKQDVVIFRRYAAFEFKV